MKPNKRQKICYNCEGDVDLDVIVCPFCAADLREEKPEQFRSDSPYSLPKNDSEHSLYPTPKTGVRDSSVEGALPQVPAQEEKPKNIFGPTLLFTLGVQLFLLGLLMFLFSHKGVVVLKWDARNWFLYIFASLPLLFFGFKAISKL